MYDKYVGLVRVSTVEQGESRLGLDAGLSDLHRYVEHQGAELVTVLEEVESGTHDDLIDRPTLQKALTLCKRYKACLLVPKVDRLVRSTEVHTDIKRSRVPFRAVDNPTANELTLDVLVAVAANEARAISQRTKDALRQYREQRRVSKRVRALYPDGVPADVVEATAGKLGAHLVGSRLTSADRDKGRAKGNDRQSREALEVYADLVGDMRAWRDEGASLRVIASRLNESGHATRSGTAWRPVQVKRVLDRAKHRA